MEIRKEQDAQDTDNAFSEDDDEEEDDNGFLASGALEDQVNATLYAIQSKDSRLYNPATTFYSDNDSSNGIETSDSGSKGKPLFLNGFHRETLLNGVSELANAAPQSTFAQQQDEFKRDIVRAIHDATADHTPSHLASSTGEQYDDFLTRKGNPDSLYNNQQQPSFSASDVEVADKDPEAFLRKFLDNRAWVVEAGTEAHAFQSDDEEEDQRAEEIEEAYNLRFESHQGVNEKLFSHARDAVAKYSVRKEPLSKRKRARQSDQSRKEASRLQQLQEKAQFRRLKVEDAQEKMRKVEDAAGLIDHPLKVEDWIDFIADDWDHDRWEAEMAKKFGVDYYDREHVQTNEAKNQLKRQIKKPVWMGDIDISDIIPHMENEEGSDHALSASTRHDREKHNYAEGHQRQLRSSNGEQKREARNQRRKVEQLVDQKLELDMALSRADQIGGGQFRYRETSPVTFGLTAQDILMASDSQLNQHAGLKKMATFRDSAKKRKDRKRLGKRGRLRSWRKETFGNEEGPRLSLQDLIRDEEDRLEGLEVRDECKAETNGKMANVHQGKEKTRSRRRGRERSG